MILRHDIQNEGTHDSIEDARTALQLYEFFCQMANEGGWEEELERVYRKGKEMVGRFFCFLCSSMDICIRDESKRSLTAYLLFLSWVGMESASGRGGKYMSRKIQDHT